MDHRREEQIARLEEAALNILMEDYACTEGEALAKEFEEAQQTDPVQMPQALDQKCLKLIDRAYAKERWREVTARTAKVSVKLAASVAAVFCLVLLVTMPVFGTDSLCELLGRWTEDLFSFDKFQESSEQPQEGYEFHTDHADLEHIYAAAAEMGITQPAVPMWVPEEYTLANVKVMTVRNGLWLHATLACGEEYIHISVTARSEGPETLYEKDSGEVQWIELNGIAHYLFTNNGVHLAAWKTGNLECYISATDETVDLVKILKSVY